MAGGVGGTVGAVDDGTGVLRAGGWPGGGTGCW